MSIREATNWVETRNGSLVGLDASGREVARIENVQRPPVEAAWLRFARRVRFVPAKPGPRRRAVSVPMDGLKS